MGTSYYSRVAPALKHSANGASKSDDPNLLTPPPQDKAVLAESLFHSMLTLERRRAERSCKAFVLMLLDAGLETGADAAVLSLAVDVAVFTKRETDLLGWYKENAILGVIFTEVNLIGDRPVSEILRTRLEKALVKNLGREKANKVSISLHVFPESWDKTDPGWAASRQQRPAPERKSLPTGFSVVALGGK